MDPEPTPDHPNNDDGQTKTLTIDTTRVSFPSNNDDSSSSGTRKPKSGKKPVKPALKSSSSMDEELDDGDDEYETDEQRKRKLKKKKKNRTLKWDEAKIQEHDQLRGTRMKIDEPNTPFAHYYDSGSETDGSVSSHKRNAHHKISWDALTNKLDAHAAAVALYPPSSPSSHGGVTTDDDEDDRKERQRRELKRLEFQEHRKKHYNEMEVVRRFRRDHPDGIPTANGHSSDDDDDDDEE